VREGRRRYDVYPTEGERRFRAFHREPDRRRRPLLPHPDSHRRAAGQQAASSRRVDGRYGPLLHLPVRRRSLRGHDGGREDEQEERGPNAGQETGYGGMMNGLRRPWTSTVAPSSDVRHRPRLMSTKRSGQKKWVIFVSNYLHYI